MRFRELRLRKDPRCPLCGEHPTIRALIDYEDFCGTKPVPAAKSQISVRELADALARGEDLLIVDVREAFELAIARFPGALHIPLGTLPARAQELPTTRTLVMACHRGNRSQRALELLRAQGFTRVQNLAGGIDAWSREVDRSVPRY
jgi:adenylyltransferase/sulfurtransferase